MKKKMLFGLVVAVALVAVAVFIAAPWRSTEEHVAHEHDEHAAHDHEEHAAHDHDGHDHTAHESAHGGCLNAIVTCENGHAEVVIDGDTMKLWFVGGGSDTKRAVRIPDSEVNLAITLDTETEARPLVLAAAPDALAEETVGDCSQFEGRADWLAGVAKFTATATVTFKGQKQPLRIEYPEGYDPD